MRFVNICFLLNRMDIDQSARRQARDEFQVIDPDYYDMEGAYISSRIQ
jgi:hypothetical protein